MPVDLRCFEQRPELKDVYIRGHDDGGKDDAAANVTELLNMALEQRATMIRLRNDRDRCLAAHRKDKDKANSISKQASNNKAQSTAVAAVESHTVVMKKMEEQLAVAALALNETMWQLPNWIDVDLLAPTLDVSDATDSTPSFPTTASSVTALDSGIPPEMATPADPLFASRCYEEIDNATVLVGSGHCLATALQEYFVKSLSNLVATKNKKDDMAKTLPVTTTTTAGMSIHSATHWTLPATFTVSSSSLPSPIHTVDCAMARCARTSTTTTTTSKLQQQSPQQPLTNSVGNAGYDPIDSSGAVSDHPVPSWISLLRNQAGTYWDRQLPRLHILSTTSTPPNNATDCIPEVNRRQSWRTCSDKAKRKSHVAAAWYERLALRQQIQIVVLTGPSLEADSRPWQRLLMEHIRQCYQALLEFEADRDQKDYTIPWTKNCHVPSRFLQIRYVPAAELSLMESSRLQLWGYWPHHVSKPPVCLAYLSNLQEYCTTNAPCCELRHGTTKEGLHVLHGVVCSVGETMEWMSQHGARPHMMLVPPCIVSSSRSGLYERIVYTRRVVVNANGKRHVQEIVVSPAAVADATETTTSRHNLTNSAPTLSPPRQEQQPLQHPNKLPPVSTAMLQTPERIRAEGLSSPFFLPFYYR